MGQKLAAYLKDTGAIAAFYDTEDSPAPDGALTIPITVAQWQSCLDQPGQWRVAAGALEPISLSADQQLADAQNAQVTIINAAYASAVQQPVTFKTEAAFSTQYEADSDSQAILTQAVQGYTASGSVPSGFFWVSADNTRVPFTLADLQGLNSAILARNWSAFQRKQTLKSNIAAATNVTAVQSVTW
ncbi:hypothetical protein C3Y08_01980 [Burkholderia gladioli]|uniref:DUF4376 domain-containing protein n=1 Tax=Burkholderia gladioli TaxID=28095 RepID=UPI000CDAFA37|nr:DUF4376 domain-containing protein [Burkholderia gladioli]POS10239.1 hypothetical protein C3Y08_01980 [Burkholderia gladioli]